MTYSLNTLNSPRGNAAPPRVGVARFAHEIVLVLGFESADHPLDAWMARALELVADHGGRWDAQAVAASAAFPVVFAPTNFEAFHHRCDTPLPPWVEPAARGACRG